MVIPVVLVNGLPAAGKTTLARQLSRALGIPLFSKDAIKETHADVLGLEPPSGYSDREWSRALGAAASQTMWALLADSPHGAVLESCWPTDSRRLVVEGLGSAGARAPTEVWCEAPLEVARRRFEQRHPRHVVHGAPPTEAEWERWGAIGRPLALGPLYRVDTTRPIDIDAIAAWVRRQV